MHKAAGHPLAARFTTREPLLRKLIDPYKAPLRSLPRNDHELFIAANNSHLLVFDNVSNLPWWLSDALCRLATGGGMMAYPIQTAPEELVGDGYAMAMRAGAHLIDMDMVQFLPCCLAAPPIWQGVQFPWMIGPQSGIQAWLLNRYGERFMEAADPARKEGSTRDIIALAFQTDKTRVATLLMCRDLSGLFYPFLNVRTAPPVARSIS